MTPAAPRTSLSDPLASPGFIVARSLLLCDRLAVDESAAELARRVQDHARMRFATDVAGAPQKDLELWVRDLLRPKRGTGGRHPTDRLYEQMLAALAIQVDWTAGGPVVPVEAVRTWLVLLNDFDESFLLCFDLLRGGRRRNQPPPVPPHWRIVARVSDRQLDELLESRTTDLHVHLGGVRQASIAWARTMADERGWADFDPLHGQFESELGIDRRGVAEAAFHDRQQLCKTLTLPQIGEREVWREPRPLEILRDERRLLIRGLDHFRRARVTADHDPDLEESFWRYISARHKFQRCTRQPAFVATPGLAHFDSRYFRATRPGDGARHAARPDRNYLRFRSNKDFARAEPKAAARVLADEDCLAEVELRISPFDSAAGYLRFLRGWKEIEKEIESECKKDKSCRCLPKVRFAVHFLRTRRAQERKKMRIRHGPKGSIDPRDVWRSFHSEISRQTATLYDVLDDGRHEKLSRLISRIDVAGQERDTPIELFTPHLRLLRGDEVALRLLEKIACETPGRLRKPRRGNSPAHGYFVHASEWQGKLAASRYRDDLKGRLRLTLHAGEEYADPLEGLFQIWAAVETSGMMAGEGIGHALALGDPLDRWSSPFARISHLQNWASLLWLRHLLPQIDPLHQKKWEAGLLATLISRAGNAVIRSRDIGCNERAFRRCYLAENGLQGVSEAMWIRSARDEAGVEASKRAVLLPLVRDAQEWLRKHLIAKEIVIETNPSSDIRIAAPATLADLPTIRLFTYGDGKLPLCVNTDNPGTFATSIRTEYAVLRQGAQEWAETNKRPDGKPSLDEGDIALLLEAALRIGRTLASQP